ncbi:hypothetical protein V7S43_012682 [Phytophthora oleae]|uniref:Uncharacterized protein n=1 Tax=Phytophthora oleae TaxID=2107226 RepID=A0ABD3F667_9STRA
MATSCSGVTTCLSEGSTECDLTSETCPPCVYALTGGDYSCYSRDTSGACPFSGAYAECDGSSTSTSTSSKSSSKSSGSNSETTPTPTTKTPAKTTATPTEARTNAPTDAPTETPTSAPETSTTSGTSDSTSSQTGTSGTSTTTKATTAPTSSGSDTTQASQTSASDKGAEKALTSNTTATSGSPAVVNLALIGGAVVLVVIVLAFVARRVVKKKKMTATQEHTVSSGHNSAWSDRTLNTGTSGGNLYSTYSYKDNGSKDNGISMMSDSQASSTYGPGYHGQSGTDQRPTADFSNYGEQSKYAENSQYYSDYGVSTGPELAAGAAAAGHYANNTAPSGAANHFVDVTATTTSMRQSELDSIRSGQQPLTVSQLMPTAIDEDEEEAYATRRKAANQYGVAHPTTYNFQVPAAAVPPSTRKPQIFGGSTASSMRSDYDIVDPITMRDVEARNTEMLAEDSRYPKFSFESEASSADLYEGDSSEEESDEERVRHGEEHTI